MFCINCGNEVKKEERYCSKCGALNLENKENKEMKLYAKQNPDRLAKEVIKDRKKEERELKDKAYGFNLIVFLIVNVIFYLLTLLPGKQILEFIKYEGLMPYYILIETISCFYFVCMQLILKKANLPWWGLFIPLYNIYLIFKLATKRGSDCLIMLFGIIMIIAAPIVLPYSSLVSQVLVVVSYLTYILTYFLLIGSIGRRFGRSAIFTILFSFVVFPALAFSKRYQYEY